MASPVLMVLCDIIELKLLISVQYFYKKSVRLIEEVADK